MAGTTDNLNLPYPEPADANNVPADIQALAEAVDATLLASIAATAIVPSAIAAGSGIDPTGSADSTAGLQAKIDALPDGGRLYIPNGVYKLTDALVIDKPCTIAVESALGAWTSLTAGGAFDLPIQSPYLRGVVLNQTVAAKDGIKITTAGQVDFPDGIGIMFTGAAVRWVNTGHGINATPTQTYGGGSRKDHGVMGATWRNIQVFGHDGDHYGIRMVNPLLCTIDSPRCFGGGGIQLLTDSDGGNYGNTVLIHPYSNIFCEGTAHGFNIAGNAAVGGSGLMNLITMIRPQCNGEDLTAIFPTSTAPNPANQYLILAGETYAIDRLSIIGPDFESPIGMPVSLGESRGHHIDVAGTPELAGVPTLTKKANLATSTAVLTGTDNAGAISVTAAAGLTTAYASILTVEWEHRDSGTYDDIVIIGPNNGNAPSAGAYLQPITGGFELRVSINLVSGEQYKWNYFVTTGHVLNT